MGISFPRKQRGGQDPVEEWNTHGGHHRSELTKGKSESKSANLKTQILWADTIYQPAVLNASAILAAPERKRVEKSFWGSILYEAIDGEREMV